VISNLFAKCPAIWDLVIIFAMVSFLSLVKVCGAANAGALPAPLLCIATRNREIKGNSLPDPDFELVWRGQKLCIIRAAPNAGESHIA
jgi:hypothetical protein